MWGWRITLCIHSCSLIVRVTIERAERRDEYNTLQATTPQRRLWATPSGSSGSTRSTRSDFHPSVHLPLFYILRFPVPRARNGCCVRRWLGERSDGEWFAKTLLPGKVHQGIAAVSGSMTWCAYIFSSYFKSTMQSLIRNNNKIFDVIIYTLLPCQNGAVGTAIRTSAVARSRNW